MAHPSDGWGGGARSMFAGFARRGGPANGSESNMAASRAPVRVCVCANTYDDSDGAAADIRFSSVVRAVRVCVPSRLVADAYDSRPHAHTPPHCRAPPLRLVIAYRGGGSVAPAMVFRRV